jgi:CDP-glycerol glycerophosphotransferase (TagB/SpsB family)
MDGKKLDPYKITFIADSLCGSNSFALYKYFVSYQKNFTSHLILKGDELDSSTMEIVRNSKVLFYESFPKRFVDDQIVVLAWAEFPLEATGILNLDVSKDNVDYIIETLKVDAILSYSKTHRTLQNACFPTLGKKYYITGMPKNDFLFIPEDVAEQNLRKIIGISKDTKKFIIYIPTYWEKYNESRTFSNFIREILNEEFMNFLKDINAILFLKLHSTEEKFFSSESGRKFLGKLNTKESRIFLISDTILRENFVDLFEILPCFDLLITDYSSISYDWLLVNKPLVYFIPNIDIYKEKKNFY